MDVFVFTFIKLVYYLFACIWFIIYFVCVLLRICVYLIYYLFCIRVASNMRVFDLLFILFACCLMLRNGMVWYHWGQPHYLYFLKLMCKVFGRLCGVIVRCDCAVWLCDVIVRCDYVVWLCGVIMWCDCVMWLCDVIVWCDCAMWLCDVIMWCEDSREAACTFFYYYLYFSLQFALAHSETGF